MTIVFWDGESRERETCFTVREKVSSHMFKDDRRWFKISVKVEELAIDKTRAIQATPIFCNLQIY
ncbi:MAG: hypothetical protein WA364_27785 [Candidatus Nitrosopolaris sp.]